LIETGTAESLWIEYKQQTYGNTDEARAEFLADISSFANSSGGDLVIGIEEKGGVPTMLMPFAGNADDELLRLDQMAQSGLQPRISKLPTKAVCIAGRGSVLIIRAPRSYNPPHRVIFKNKNRFWARSGRGKIELDVDQLREIFTRTPQLSDRMRDFRFNRIGRIAVGEDQML
jgi:predicted HTH transcriptional regulator